MRNPGGYAVWSDPESGSKEMDTFTCCHCNTVVFVNKSLEDAGGFCRMCMAPVCKACNQIGTCTPFEKKLELMERKQSFLDAVLGKD